VEFLSKFQSDPIVGSKVTPLFVKHTHITSDNELLMNLTQMSHELRIFYTLSCDDNPSDHIVPLSFFVLIASACA
jgi:hypothetical protein